MREEAANLFTFNGACTDNRSFTFPLDNLDKNVGCAWLTQNENAAPARKSRYCVKNNVRSQCSFSCDACSGPSPMPFVTNNCSDDPSFKFTLNNGKKRVNCAWLTKNRRKAKRRKRVYCPKPDVSENCASTCNSCPPPNTPPTLPPSPTPPSPSPPPTTGGVPFSRLSSRCQNGMSIQSVNGLTRKQCEQRCVGNSSE